MKVSKLMGILREYDENAEVYLSCDYYSEYGIEGTMAKADGVSEDKYINILIIRGEPLDKEQSK